MVCPVSRAGGRIRTLVFWLQSTGCFQARDRSLTISHVLLQESTGQEQSKGFNVKGELDSP